MSFQFTIDTHLPVRSPNFPHGHFAGGLDLESLFTNISICICIISDSEKKHPTFFRIKYLYNSMKYFNPSYHFCPCFCSNISLKELGSINYFIFFITILINNTNKINRFEAKVTTLLSFHLATITLFCWALPLTIRPTILCHKFLDL